MNQKTIRAKVDSITPLTDSILRLVLLPDVYIEYQAGQYLQILSGEESLSYSIANAPLGSHKYELHIRHSQENKSTQSLLAEIKRQGAVTIRLPFGCCHINNLDVNRPILFIAGGTGFSPIKAMIEQLLATHDKRSFELLWGARSQSDLYMNDKISHWQAHASHFRYFSLLSNSNKEIMASRIIELHQHDLKLWQYIIAGPLDMAYTIRDRLVAEGLPRVQLFSDAFSFEEGGE